MERPRTPPPPPGAGRERPATPRRPCDKRRLVDHLVRLNTEIDRVDERLGEIHEKLTRLIQQHGSLPEGLACSPTLRARDPEAEQALRRLAARGVSSVVVDDDPAYPRKHEVRIDGGPAFRVSKTLGELLRVLTSDEGRPSDHLVPWRGLDEVSRALGDRLGREFKPHAIEQNLSRLRRALSNAGENPYLVQTSELGVRFALRRAVSERQPL